MINSNALGSAASMQVEVPMPMHAQRARARARARSVRALTAIFVCAGCAGLNWASVCRGQSRRSWAAEGVILRCRWPGLRNGALAGTEGSIRARVAADARSSGTLLGGGRLVRSRWAEASGRPRQVAQAKVVIGTDAAEGETPSDRALWRVGSSAALLYFFHVFS